MTVKYQIYRIVEKEVVIKGDRSTDYEDYSETVTVLIPWDEAYDTKEKALESLQSLNIGNKYIILEIYQ